MKTQNRNLVAEATELVRKKNKASVRLLRNELKIGGDTAVTVLAQLETAGVIDSNRSVIAVAEALVVGSWKHEGEETTIEMSADLSSLDVISRKLSDPNNAESGIMLRKDAERSEIAQLIAGHGEFTAMLKELGKIGVKAGNKARALGIILQTMCGHKHMDADYFAAHLKGKVPFDFELSKWYVSVANSQPKAITEVGQAVEIFLPGFQAVGMIAAPARGEPQNPSNFPLIQKFLKQATTIRGLFTKAISDAPPENWTRTEREEFIDATDWLQIEREKVQKLLAE